jgi:hypothetical protein
MGSFFYFQIFKPKLMKNKLIIAGLFAFTSIAFNACTEDEETTPTPTPGPTPIVYGEVKTKTNVTLGGQENSSTGSFYSTDTALVFKSVETSASTILQSKIDLVYFFGGTNGASIGAPSDATVIFVHTNNTSLPNWPIKNATLFSSQSISLAKYDSVKNDSIFKKLDSASFNLSLVTALSANRIIAFKTVKGKIGMIKVNSVDGTLASNRTINFDVKVQK